MARIVLLGGGFSSDPDTLLDDWLLRMLPRLRPRVCFLPTASGDSEVYMQRFHAALDGRCETSALGLFARDDRDPRDVLLNQDAIYVGGGNTANALAVWRVHGVDRALVEAYHAGVVLGGISAGMICWFESCLTDSFGPVAVLHDGLGLLAGSACPHFDSEPARRPTYLRAVASGELPSGWALDDGAAALFTDGELVESAARRPGAHLRRVQAEPGGEVAETTIEARLLG
ncbi:MAG: peptidase E [Actinomycetota bacterium]|nr:peptidase E [Actinomycetota bacterium]